MKQRAASKAPEGHRKSQIWFLLRGHRGHRNEWGLVMETDVPLFHSLSRIFPFMKASTSVLSFYPSSLLSKQQNTTPPPQTKPRRTHSRMFSLCSDQFFTSSGVTAAAGSSAGAHRLQEQPIKIFIDWDHIELDGGPPGRRCRTNSSKQPQKHGRRTPNSLCLHPLKGFMRTVALSNSQNNNGGLCPPAWGG